MRRRKLLPSYRLHKPTGQAVVTLGGKDYYLGRHGSLESREAYDRLTAEWLAAGRVLPARPRSDTPPDGPAPTDAEPGSGPGPGPTGPTINDVVLAFWRHARTHYRRPDGQPTQELQNLRLALRPLRRLYGSTPAADFGPLALRSIQQRMVRSGLGRTTVNARINRIRRAFKWAVGREMVPPAVHQALQAVPGLQRGRTEAREPKGVGPVPIERVEATLPHLNRTVAAMVRIQLLTGCRAEEVALLRGCDLARGEPNWEYRPASHKTAWRGKDRVIIIGPRARAIIEEFLKPDPESYLFDPRDVVESYHAERARQRKSKPTPSEVARRVKTRPGQCRAAHYDRPTYRQAVVRACDRAFLHPDLSRIDPKKLTAAQRAELKEWRKAQRWSPLQLRHTAATLIRSRYGLEASQVVLGHSRADVTQLYAERDLGRAHAVIAEIG